MQRALISVWDKEGVVDFVAGLKAVFPALEVVASGGTAKALREHFEVTGVGEITRFPECFGGRVKTLHPRLLGGILYRRGRDEEDARNLEITPVDMVICNLYPFESKKAEGLAGDELLEFIDVGGPTMLMSAAKNYKSVAVVSSPQQYGRVLQELGEQECLSEVTRRELAAEAVAQVAFQRAAILEALGGDPDRRLLAFEKAGTLRYGENPHQKAQYFRRPGAFVFRSEQGKALSYNNLLDLDAACEAVSALEDPACAVVKHTNPCGLATGDNAAQALERAWAGDPISAFGSVIAFNCRVDSAALEVLGFGGPRTQRRFFEVLAAPDLSDGARVLLAKAKNLRLVRFEPSRERERMISIRGGLLIQDSDEATFSDAECVTDCPFPETLLPLARFAVLASRQVRSNAIAIARQLPDGGLQLLGIGAGQPNRVAALRLAAAKMLQNLALEGHAGERLSPELAETIVLASDGFFPFPDNVDAAAAAGIKYLVQPGGSRKDGEVAERANALGMAMLLSGCRHFRH